MELSHPSYILIPVLTLVWALIEEQKWPEARKVRITEIAVLKRGYIIGQRDQYLFFIYCLRYGYMILLISDIQTASKKNYSNAILFCLAYCLAIFPQNNMIPLGTWTQQSKPSYIIFLNFLLIFLSSYLMINIKVLSI